MTVQIQVNDQNIPFTLVPEKGSWHSSEQLKESDFPLVKVVDGRRYELYSDRTFAEVEK